MLMSRKMHYILGEYLPIMNMSQYDLQDFQIF